MRKFPNVKLKDLPYAKFILQQIKKEAAFERGFWVCELLSKVNETRLQGEASALIERIETALAPYALVTQWAYEQGSPRFTASEKDAYRRQWIDHMLKELENGTHTA